MWADVPVPVSSASLLVFCQGTADHSQGTADLHIPKVRYGQSTKQVLFVKLYTNTTHRVE